ncbi:hypothetical protein [Sulfitobacter profundi]|uniref:Uncharacterized protein n=1 Tax=Sulfitobacter profundi TaxID=2679961 RepID=A0ABW1YYP0_9RHOB
MIRLAANDDIAVGLHLGRLVCAPVLDLIQQFRQLRPHLARKIAQGGAHGFAKAFETLHDRAHFIHDPVHEHLRAALHQAEAAFFGVLLCVGRKRQHRAKGDKGHETCHAIDVGGAFGISSLLPMHGHKPA